jgi:hypothetical protein
MAKANFKCPTCGASVWDNRSDRRSDRAPMWKCSNKGCTGGANGQVWASWDDPPKGVTVSAPDRSGGASAVPLAGRATVTVAHFVAMTGAMALPLLQALKQACAAADVDPSPAVLLTEAMTTVRQAWVCFERGALTIPGTELAAPPAPPPAVDKYLTAIQHAADRQAVLKALSASVMDGALSAEDKAQVERLADHRLQTLSMVDQLPDH